MSCYELGCPNHNRHCIGSKMDTRLSTNWRNQRFRLGIARESRIEEQAARVLGRRFLDGGTEEGDEPLVLLFDGPLLCSFSSSICWWLPLPSPVRPIGRDGPDGGPVPDIPHRLKCGLPSSRCREPPGSHNCDYSWKYLFDGCMSHPVSKTKPSANYMYARI
jgi:hypothetical protein